MEKEDQKNHLSLIEQRLKDLSHNQQSTPITWLVGGVLDANGDVIQSDSREYNTYLQSLAG